MVISTGARATCPVCRQPYMVVKGVGAAGRQVCGESCAQAVTQLARLVVASPSSLFSLAGQLIGKT